MPTSASQPTQAPSGLALRRADRRSSDGRRSDRRWQAILAGAAQVFRTRGYANCTLEDVAIEEPARPGRSAIGVKARADGELISDNTF